MRHALTTALLVALQLLALQRVHAQTFPIFFNDPTDSNGVQHPILPGVFLILPQPDGKFDPPLVDTSVTGDVDIVIRAGDLLVGPSIPVPLLVPPTAVAGGGHVTTGSEIPFTVVASDGDPATPTGDPLLGPELDGIPVLVVAFADLDGDGIVGPTSSDPAGTIDNARELQESDYFVGRQVALFQDGVARGQIAVSHGAPASAGGLVVVLTAAAYVGPFDPGFMSGSVPDGPPVATLMPFFPRLDPSRVVDSGGQPGPAAPDERLGIELEPAFDAPVDDAVLATPFALPTDGSSPTIDRAVVHAGPLSRVRFMRPSTPGSFTGDEDRVALHAGGNGSLFEPVDQITIADSGAGTVVVQLVPVDLLGNVTDPPVGTEATVLASPGVSIVAPDVDDDLSRETVAVATAAGVDLTLGDDRGSGSAGTSATLVVEFDGFPAARLGVQLTGLPPAPIPMMSSPGAWLGAALLACGLGWAIVRRRAGQRA